MIAAVNGHRGDDTKVATVAVIGPLPPPSHGHMVFTQRLLESQLLARRFRLVHVDISDHRELRTVGRLELVNVLLALRHFGRLIKVLATERPDIVHVPLAQNRWGSGATSSSSPSVCSVGRRSSARSTVAGSERS